MEQLLAYLNQHEAVYGEPAARPCTYFIEQPELLKLEPHRIPIKRKVAKLECDMLIPQKQYHALTKESPEVVKTLMKVIYLDELPYRHFYMMKPSQRPVIDFFENSSDIDV